MCFVCQTNNYVAFCTETENPSPLHQPRHRKKKVTRGFSSVPSKEKPDGTKVYGFERMHLLGVIGILITAGLTQKRRLSDHWGTGFHDDYILVRSVCPAICSCSSTLASSTWPPRRLPFQKTTRTTTPNTTAGMHVMSCVSGCKICFTQRIETLP